jgi:hypothetical protein
MKRRLLTVATLTPVGVLGVSGLAFAFWTVASSGAAGTAAVDSLAAPATVSTSNVSATSVTINVGAGPASGPSPTSYRVDRTAPSAASSVCTITGSTGSCVDASPVSGQTNTYAVFSRLGTSWVSGTSATTSASVPSTDTTAPTTTATPSPAPNGAGWNNANVSVALAATDNSGGSGVKQITYSASGAQPIGSTIVSGASTSVSITTDGTTTISFFATDNANNVEATKTITINLDKTAPSVTSVTSTLANGTYKTGQVVPVTVTFSESVTVTGTPQLSITTGNPATTAVNYASGSGTNTLTFNYTVASGNSSADLDYASAAALALNGGTIRDTASNNAVLTLPNPGGVGSLGGNKNIVVDAVAPTAFTVDTTPASGGDGKASSGDTFTFSYSEIVSPSSIISGWNGSGTQSVTLTFDHCSGNGSPDCVTFGSANLGSLNLRGAFVPNGSNKSFTATANLTQAVVSGRTLVTVTLTSSPSTASTDTANYQVIWTPSASVTDPAGNAASTTSVTQTSAAHKAM